MSKYIDADALIDRLDFCVKEGMGSTIAFTFKHMVADAPTIDIVRCQDCKHWVYNFNGCSRNPCTEPWYALDFCNYGEREGE